jgi:hypothetical protein
MIRKTQNAENFVFANNKSGFQFPLQFLKRGVNGLGSSPLAVPLPFQRSLEYDPVNVLPLCLLNPREC